MKSPKNSYKYVFKTLLSLLSVTLPPYIASPIKYLKVSQGNSSSYNSWAFVRYIDINLNEILKSLSLKS